MELKERSIKLNELLDEEFSLLQNPVLNDDLKNINKKKEELIQDLLEIQKKISIEEKERLKRDKNFEELIIEIEKKAKINKMIAEERLKITEIKMEIINTSQVITYNAEGKSEGSKTGAIINWKA